jgi:hypothetical protein
MLGNKSKIKTGEIVVPGFASQASEEPPVDQIEAEVEESIEASVSLEKRSPFLFSRQGQ